MQSTSRDSLSALRAEVDALTAGAADLPATAGELYAVSDLLATQPRLRRMLSDPAVEPDRRRSSVSQLLGAKISAPALGIVAAAAAARWSSPWDLSDALGLSGDQLLFAAAERSGAMDAVEDELFRFGRILEGEPQLATLLDDQSVAAQRRQALLSSVTAGKVSPITGQLLGHALQHGARVGYALRVEDLAAAAAARQSRSIALVRSAVPLTEAQESRLAQLLSEIYGRTISVRTQLDSSVLGGLVIRVGDELIDGSIASRLAAARSALTGR